MVCGRWWHLQLFMGLWENISCMSLYFQGNVSHCKCLLVSSQCRETYPTSAADVTELFTAEWLLYYVSFNVMHVCTLFPFSGKKKTSAELLLQLKCPHTSEFPFSLSLFFFSARPDADCKFVAAEWRCISALIPLIWPVLNKQVLISTIFISQFILLSFAALESSLKVDWGGSGLCEEVFLSPVMRFSEFFAPSPLTMYKQPLLLWWVRPPYFIIAHLLSHAGWEKSPNKLTLPVIRLECTNLEQCLEMTGGLYNNNNTFFTINVPVSCSLDDSGKYWQKHHFSIYFLIRVGSGW